jgi:hypothetical protein
VSFRRTPGDENRRRRCGLARGCSRWCSFVWKIDGAGESAVAGSDGWRWRTASRGGPEQGRQRSAGDDLGFIGRRSEPWRAQHARQDGGGLAGCGVSRFCVWLGPDGLRPGHDRAGGDGLDRVGPTACAWAELKKRTTQAVRGAPADFGLMGQKQMWAEKDERKR